jgi:ClpP class serine protease
MTKSPFIPNMKKIAGRNAFALVAATEWAIDQSYDNAALRQILAIAERSHTPDFEALEARLARPLENTETAAIRDGVAIVPVVGPIMRYANLFTAISGATSNEVLALDVQAALDNPAVRAVVLNVDSPGGTVSGTNEMAKLIARNRAADGKPIFAFVSAAGASGALWIASAVGPGRLFADDTALIGSIGVVTVARDDTSAIDEALGVREVTFTSSQSPLKRVDPFTEEGASVIQRKLDQLADTFISFVAVNRGVTVETVINDFGQGDTLIAADAEAVGMIDGITSLEELLIEIQAQAGGGRPVDPPLRFATTEKDKTTMTKITASDLRDKYPEAVRELEVAATTLGDEAGHKRGFDAGVAEGRKTGHAEGVAHGKDVGRTEGAEAERARVADLDDNALPGFEAILQECKADGKSTGADLAVKIIAAQKAQGSTALAAAKQDEAALKAAGLPIPAASAEGGNKEADAALAAAEADGRGLSDDAAAEAAGKRWEASDDLREEFATKSAYLAYCKAERSGFRLASVA